MARLWAVLGVCYGCGVGVLMLSSDMFPKTPWGWSVPCPTAPVPCWCGGVVRGKGVLYSL